MCVVAIAWRGHPDFELVVAGNRDELHARPSSGLHRWDDGSGLIGGKDLVSGGMWLGVSEHGRRFGVVTNRRSDQPMNPQARSRGLLLRDVLSGYPLSGVVDEPDAYNPVNIGFIGRGQAEVLSNYPTQRRRFAGAPSGGADLFGLSNGDIDQPSPRAEALMRRVSGWLEAPGGLERLFEALADETPTVDSPSEAPFGAQPLFMRHPIYGTRCSTVIVVDRHGKGRAVERTFDGLGRVVDDREVGFAWG